MLLYSHHVYARHHYVVYVEVLELYGGTNKARLVLVYAALVLRRFNVSDKFVFGDCRGVLVLDFAYKPFPRHKQYIYGEKQNYEKPKKGPHAHGVSFGKVFCQSFGRYLAENEHGYGNCRGGNHSRQLLVGYKARKQKRGESRRRNVYYVVAYEYGAQKPVVPVEQAQYFFCRTVAVRLERAKSDFIGG